MQKNKQKGQAISETFYLIYSRVNSNIYSIRIYDNIPEKLCFVS